MFITKSNILKNKTPTSIVTGENGNFLPQNITDPDFSTLYTSTSNSELVVDFGPTTTINYVAFAGTNIATGTDFSSSFSVKDGSSTIATTYVKYNNCCVVSFQSRSFTNLRVSMVNAAGNRPPTIRFVSAGTGFTVPNDGENSGYNRQFLNRGTKSKTSINDVAGPTSYLKTNTDLSGALRLPNMTKDFSENEWQDFLNFAVDNHFFIREQDPIQEVENNNAVTSNNNSAYLCYGPSKFSATAHPLTRSLNNLSVSFKVFNGL